MQQTDASNALHAFLAAEKDVGTNPADLVAAMADLAPVRERILATAVTPPTAPELIPIAKRKLADLIAAGNVVNGLAFERQNPDGTTTRGAITVGGMVLWWHPEQQSALYEELRAAIDAGSETATHADALAWVKGAHQALADVCGMTLTDEQCDAFRRLPMPFNDMVREIHAAGAEHRTEPAAPRCPAGQERSRLFRPGPSSSVPVSIKVATTEDVEAAMAAKAKREDAKKQHAQRFMDAFHGIKGHHVIAVMNIVTRGIEWRHCSKAHIADSYATAMLGGRISLHPDPSEDMRRLDFESARRAAIERDLGTTTWNTYYTPLPQDPMTEVGKTA